MYRRRGLADAAAMAESFAVELEDAIRSWLAEELTLDKAADESGYSYSSLQKRIANGDLPNVGGKGSPRVRRSDLPCKGGGFSEPDLAALVLRA